MNRKTKHQSHNTKEIPVCTCMVSSFTFFCSYSLHIFMCTCIVTYAKRSGCMVYGPSAVATIYFNLHICSYLKETVCDDMYLISGGQVDVSSCMHQ